MKIFDLYQKNIWKFLFWISVLVVFSWISASIVNSFYFPNSDFSSFWLAGKLVLSDENLYNSEVWNIARASIGSTWFWEIGFLYPYPLAIIFTFISLIPYKTAFILWNIFSQLIILSSILLLFSHQISINKKYYYLPFILGVAIFRPTFIVLRFGQLSALLLLIICLTIYLWKDKRWLLGGVIFGFLMLKPSIGGVIIFIVGMLLLINKNWMALKGMLVSNISLLFLGLLLRPSWAEEYLLISQNKFNLTFGVSPTVWGLINWTCYGNNTCQSLLSILSIAVLVFLIWRILILNSKNNSFDVGHVFAVVIPISVFSTPYLWAYDQLLLVVPVYFILDNLINKNKPYLYGALLMTMISISAYIFFIPSFSVGRDYMSAFLSLEILFLYFWSRNLIALSDK